MPSEHSKATIISMAIVATGITVLLHEGVGHGVTSWLRGGVPTELTSNHLSSLHEDRWIEAGGTLVNLLAGTLALLATHAAGARAGLRYFCWLLAAHNLFSGTGYFMFSGIFGFGDWQQVITGLPHQALVAHGDGSLWPHTLRVRRVATGHRGPALLRHARDIQRHRPAALSGQLHLQLCRRHP